MSNDNEKKFAKKNLGQKVSEFAKKSSKEAAKYAKVAGNKTEIIADVAKGGMIKAKDSAKNFVDANGDGQIDIEDILILGLKMPGVRISRDEFLRKELMKHYSGDVIEKAISSTPAKANIPIEKIDDIANSVIDFERIGVTGISTVLGLPGGVAMAATIPADLAQYYGYMLRTSQKLLYLYGFPEIQIEENGQTFDSETLNILTLCLGVMYGVAGANNAIKAMAKALGSGVQKQLMKKALTKGTIYPIVKSVSKWFGVHMTKEVFTGAIGKAIPVIGGVVGGGITFATFKPCCNKLKESLRDTILSNPNAITDDDVIDVIARSITDGTDLDQGVLNTILVDESNIMSKKKRRKFKSR